jgi:hypothetical protein
MLQKNAPGQRQRYSLKLIFWLIATLLGAIQAWVNRFSLSSDDVIAYLDIGDAYLQGKWDVAINGYWSPFYSWLLALTLSVLKPSSYWEFPVVKLVNFLIYLFALVCFDFFLQELIIYYQEKILPYSSNRIYKIPKWVWLVSGYTLFFWSSLQWIGVYSDTPDMLVAAFVYLAAGIVLRVYKRSENWFNFIILGIILGFGYLSKTAMFPIAFAFLVASISSSKNLHRSLPRVLVALLVFTITVTPFITAISTARGRPTFGDTGKLNYVWIVTSGARPYRFWHGEEPDSGIPKHPPRKIFDDPETFEFGTPVGGTYPPWHDPSYWYEGLKINFNLEKQTKVLIKNIIYYYQLFLAGLIFSYLILVSVSGRAWLAVKELTANWRILVPALAGLCIYLVAVDIPSTMIKMQPNSRYIAPFIVLLFAGVFSSVRLPNFQESKRLLAGMSIAVLVIFNGQLFYQASTDLWTGLITPQHNIHWQIANRLNQLGVKPGDKVAVLGYYIFPHYHWARLARVKIVSEVLDEKEFWQQTNLVRNQVLKTIEITGAKVIVQKPTFKIPDAIAANGWQELDRTGYYVHFFKD